MLRSLNEGICCKRFLMTIRCTSSRETCIFLKTHLWKACEPFPLKECSICLKNVLYFAKTFYNTWLLSRNSVCSFKEKAKHGRSLGGDSIGFEGTYHVYIYWIYYIIHIMLHAHQRKLPRIYCEGKVCKVLRLSKSFSIVPMLAESRWGTSHSHLSQSPVALEQRPLCPAIRMLRTCCQSMLVSNRSMVSCKRQTELVHATPWNG